MKFTTEQASIIQIASEILSTYLNVGIVSLTEYFDEKYEVIDPPLIYDDDDRIEYDDGTYGYNLISDISFDEDTNDVTINYFEDLFNNICVIVNITEDKDVLGFFMLIDEKQYIYINETGIFVADVEEDLDNDENINKEKYVQLSMFDDIQV